MKRKVTVEQIVRHVNARIQQCENAIDKGAPFQDCQSRKEELDALYDWILARSV